MISTLIFLYQCQRFFLLGMRLPLNKQKKNGGRMKKLTKNVKGGGNISEAKAKAEKLKAAA